VKARVVVDAHEVEGTRELVAAALKARERRDPEIPPSGRERLEERRVVEPPGMPGEEGVERVSRAVRGEVHHVVRDPDRGAGRFLAQNARGLRVRREDVVESAPRSARVGEAWRDLTVEKASEEQDERLVEREEKPDVRREGARRLPGEAREGVDRGRRSPGCLLVEPSGVGVVVERHDRLEAERDEALDEAPVAREGGFVEDAPARLDAAPRHGEPEGVRAEVGRERGVLLVSAPRVRRAATRAAFRAAGGFPVRPVARIAALDLVVGHGDSEEPRTIREREDAHFTSR
jgi:hypothetical protein